jgi:hypothetical protein
MATPRPSIEQLRANLKKALNSPNLNLVKQTYLVEKIKLLNEYIGKKQK